MKKFLLASATAFGLMAAGAAHAGLSIVGGTAGTIPGGSVSNAALSGLGFGTAGSLGGYYGGQIDVTAPGTVKFEFLGFEAGATNVFTAGANSFSTFAVMGGQIFNAAGVVPSFTQAVVAGLLSFSFGTNVDGVIGANPVVNGSNVLPATNVLNFFSTFSTVSAAPGAGGTSGNVLYLYFDDTGTGPGLGTNGDDDNHDDMVIKLTFSPLGVPEPATLALFGAGLVGLGMAARRRRRA